ncbi:Pkinase-domain-containing protein [Rhizoclosmatium globosum]|uniref:Pkinase-domain-containing protein n=1 Tax=Rhizoclosmatium globosum TaxID=329046 RepID=A0A1Y2CJZ3_9FUNG|nr:Pkinase-domain-containing protein [Rhizoclosmatium globosum]|eukprot:ORY47320.1 Pkinase-domain-containing protein [Rhizoclosmatium globosum]
MSMQTRILSFLQRSVSFKYDTNATNGVNKFEDVYTLNRSLGKGSFAVVYLTTRNADQAKFATKVMEKRKIKKEELKSELSILKEVDHPLLTGLIDFYESENYVYLVMELAEGGSLFDHIQIVESYTEKDAVVIVKQLLEAIEYLHEKGIVHRDLKPENILLRKRNELTPVLITDFGLSKFTQDDTLLKTLCGSPFYVAPDVLNVKWGSGEGYGRAVDMWSLGVITFILLSGYPPFTGNSNSIIFQKIFNCDYEFDPEYWNDVSPSAKDFIEKLLVLDPNERLTASEALQHKWLSDSTASGDFNLLPSVLKGNVKFKKAANAIRVLEHMRRLTSEKRDAPFIKSVVN